MGASALRTRCAYNCAGSGPGCGSGDGSEAWLAEELRLAISAQDATKIKELLDIAPHARDREFNFPAEDVPMPALALALQHRHPRAVQALLEAGVSPNLPLSAQQREIYAQRSQLAALNGADPDLQHLVPNTHFESLCASQHKELFLLLLERSANPNSGIIQVSYCGDLAMLDALLGRSAEPNCWQRSSTPLISSVRSKIQPHEKVVSLLRAAADPNFIGAGGAEASSGHPPYPPLTISTRKRDYRMVRTLLEAGADVNQVVADEGLPNVLFWATYWGELELIKLFVTLSRHRLDLSMRKYTDETVLDVARTSKGFAAMKKPRHIAKLPLPSRQPAVYETIVQVLEEYRDLIPDTTGRTSGTTCAPGWTLTGSTTATRRDAAAGSR